MATNTRVALLSICLFLYFSVFSQQKDKSPGDRINVSGTYTLRKVFDIIYEQTGYQVTYNNSLFNDKEKVKLQLHNSPVETVLREVFKGKSLDWTFKDNFITIRAANSKLVRESPYNSANSLNSRISGKVISEDGTALSGANILINGSTRGTVTDNNGYFNITNAPENATVQISFTGYITQELPVKANQPVSVTLNVMVNNLDEKVVVAYGTSTRRSNTASVAIVKGETIKNLPNRSFDRSLQGQVPGLLITSGSGQPGGGTSNFVLRGIGTGTDASFGSSVRQPLIVIDNVPLATVDHLQRLMTRNASPLTNALSAINPADIESVSILKDAAAIALYGSKASNGVILITTKKGSAGKTKFHIHHQTDIATAINRQDRFLNQQEYLTLLKETYRNTDPVRWTDAAIDADLKLKFPTYKDLNGSTQFYSQDDWFSAFFNPSATTIINEVSASGGSDKTRYFLNLGYTKQNGTVKHTGFDRVSIRYNVSNKLNSWATFGLNTNLSYSNIKSLGSGTAESSTNGVGSVYTMSPLNPIKLKSGQYNVQPFSISGAYINNPILEGKYNKNISQAYRFIGDIFVEINLARNFRAKSVLGSDLLFSQIYEKIDPRLSLSSSRPPGNGSISEANSFFARFINTNTLTYDLKIDAHNSLSMLLGHEAQSEKQKALSVGKEGLTIPYLDDLSSAATLTDGLGSSNRLTLLSFFSQLNYSHNQRHFITLSTRRDGSSKFGYKNRYGTYWSVSGGWVISNESFVKGVAWIDYIKLRGSIGTSGNSSTIDQITQYNTLTPGNLNGIPTVSSSPGNPKIAWEKSYNTDMGVDIKVFDRLSLTVDVYKRKISNLLYSYKLPGTAGMSSIIQNVGNMNNKGVEIDLSADLIKRKNFNWNIRANWSTNRNKLAKANAPLAVNATLVNKENENYNSFYLVEWAGVDPADGKPQYYDLSGKITKTYSAADKKIVGKPQPEGFGGVTNTFYYKNWQLSTFLYYQYGYQIYDVASLITVNDGSLPFFNQAKRALNRWQKPGDHAENPRRILDNTDGGGNYAASTRALYDGDFIRLKNATLAYNFQSKIVTKLKLSSLRAYVMGNNLFLATRFKGFDPENIGSIGETSFSYPQSRNFTIGVDINF